MTAAAVELNENQGGFRLEEVDEHGNALRPGGGVIEAVLMGLHTCQI
jgi:hypothetical protein